MSHQLSTRLSRPNLPASGGISFGELIVEPASSGEDAARQLSLCLDVSKSMSGEKIEAVRQGAKWVIGLLNKQDSLSIVSFSAEAVVEMQATQMDESGKDNARELVENITIRGGTNITDGIEYSRSTLGKSQGDETSSRRILLLSDGQDRGHFERLAKDVAAEGISIMAAGIGRDYDEEVIRTLAESSQGKWRHLEEASEIREFFDRTVEDARTVVAANPTLTLDVTTGTQVNGVYRGSPQIQPIDVDWQNKTANLPIPDLNEGTAQNIVIEFKAPEREPGNDYLLANVTLRTAGDEVTEQFAISYTDDPEKLAVNNEEVEVAFEGTKLRTEMINAETQVEQEHVETKIHEMEEIHPTMDEEVTRLQEDHETIIEEGRAGKDSVSRVVEEDNH